MNPAITLDVLPARFGDCLLVECHRDGGPPWRALIDGGPTDCWPALRERLLAIPADQRFLDLVVVTHIDADHIGGALRFFEEGNAAIPGLAIGEVWFNGLPMLPDLDPGSDLTRSVGQGEDLVELLGGARPGGPPPWNQVFAGAAAMTPDHGGFTELRLDGWPTITLLSPSPKRLAILRRHWEDEVGRLQRGEVEEEEQPPLPPTELGDLRALAASRTPKDSSVANGASIAFLLEHRGASCLLTGDAFANVLGAGLAGLAEARGAAAVPVDVFKLPHHASRGNVSHALAALAPATHYVVSTNGDRFNHPDDAALARIVVPPSRGERVLDFNYRNPWTERWENPAVQATYGFTTRYPEPGTDGVRIALPAAEPAPVR